MTDYKLNYKEKINICDNVLKQLKNKVEKPLCVLVQHELLKFPFDVLEMPNRPSTVFPLTADFVEFERQIGNYRSSYGTGQNLWETNPFDFNSRVKFIKELKEILINNEKFKFPQYIKIDSHNLKQRENVYYKFFHDSGELDSVGKRIAWYSSKNNSGYKVKVSFWNLTISIDHQYCKEVTEKEYLR